MVNRVRQLTLDQNGMGLSLLALSSKFHSSPEDSVWGSRVDGSKERPPPPPPPPGWYAIDWWAQATSMALCVFMDQGVGVCF